MADALRFEAIDRFANAPQANYVDDIKTMVEIGTHSQVSDMLEFFDIGGKYQVFPKESVEKAFSEELDGLKAGVAEVVKGFDDGKPVEDLKAGLTLASECADSCAALFPALKDPDAGMNFWLWSSPFMKAVSAAVMAAIGPPRMNTMFGCELFSSYGYTAIIIFFH